MPKYTRKTHNQIFICIADDMHPYNCDTTFGGTCIHCQKLDNEYHDPRTCALCDPKYDFSDNPLWGTAKKLPIKKSKNK